MTTRIGSRYAGSSGPGPLVPSGFAIAWHWTTRRRWSTAEGRATRDTRAEAAEPTVPAPLGRSWPTSTSTRARRFRPLHHAPEDPELEVAQPDEQARQDAVRERGAAVEETHDPGRLAPLELLVHH